MSKHSLDYATDAFLCTLLGLHKPDEDAERYVTAIGFDEPDINARRLKAHKVIQKYLNQFKATEAKPITKFYLLELGIQPDIADMLLEPLNIYCVKYGITTTSRLKYFLQHCCKYSQYLRAPKPLFLPINRPIETALSLEEKIALTCKFWQESGCNYFADKKATSQIENRLLSFK